MNEGRKYDIILKISWFKVRFHTFTDIKDL